MAVVWKRLAFVDDVILKTLLTTRGDIIRRNATIPERLAKGSSGDVLTMGANDPGWSAPAGGGASLTVIAGVGTEVYNSTSPTSWTDLVLSGTIGAQATLVMLKIFSGAAAYRVCVKQNGDTDEMYQQGDGYTNAQRSDVGGHGYFWVHTDANGIIEWRTQSATNMTVDVVAYIK